MTAAAFSFPEIDARNQDQITPEHAQFFRDNGLLLIRNVLRGQELADLKTQTQKLIDMAASGEYPEAWKPDVFIRKHEGTGKMVPARVEYVVDKTPAGKTLMGHPFILRSIQVLQGRSFIPTWDSLVLKYEGRGVAIPWHRDAGPYGRPGVDETAAAINVDFYLDNADTSNCLWGIPGTNRLSPEAAAQKLAELKAEGPFTTRGTVPIFMNAGDVLFHSTLVLHGSPETVSAQRRVIYYEFRPAQVDLEMGPHSPEYIPLKQRVLLACLRQRAETPWARGEKQFVYDPDPRFAVPRLTPGEELSTYRYVHSQYRHKADEGG